MDGARIRGNAGRIYDIKSMLREKNVVVSGLLFLWQERKHHLIRVANEHTCKNSMDISSQWCVHRMHFFKIASITFYNSDLIYYEVR